MTAVRLPTVQLGQGRAGPLLQHYTMLVYPGVFNIAPIKTDPVVNGHHEFHENYNMNRSAHFLQINVHQNFQMMKLSYIAY